MDYNAPEMEEVVLEVYANCNCKCGSIDGAGAGC